MTEKFINDIGDPFFTICDESVEPVYRHPEHPITVRIMDCEGDVIIDIYTTYGLDETKKSALALAKLLNQSNSLCGKD